MAKTVRKAISTKTRFEVFKRDGFVCQYCGGHPPTVKLHVDHIVPVAEGGLNGMDNLVTSCDRCNLGKGANSLASIPQPLKERAEDVAEREIQIRGYADVMLAKRERLEADAVLVAKIFAANWGDEDIRSDHFRSIRTFVEKLGVVECMEAMDSAVCRVSSDRGQCFRYFCGICWAKVRAAFPQPEIPAPDTAAPLTGFAARIARDRGLS